jgi:hypothetical protein
MDENSPDADILGDADADARPLVLLVVWADTHADKMGTWQPIEDIEDDGEYLVETVGFVIEGAKERHLTLAQSMSPDAQVDHLLHIPVGMIRSVQQLSATAQG